MFIDVISSQIVMFVVSPAFSERDSEGLCSTLYTRTGSLHQLVTSIYILIPVTALVYGANQSKYYEIFNVTSSCSASGNPHGYTMASDGPACPSWAITYKPLDISFSSKNC